MKNNFKKEMKPSKEYLENVKKLNHAADLIIDMEGRRPAPVFIIRAVRTIMDPRTDYVIEGRNDGELIYNVMGMIHELLKMCPEIDGKWVVERNCCIPRISKEEEQEIEAFIKSFRG